MNAGRELVRVPIRNEQTAFGPLAGPGALSSSVVLGLVAWTLVVGVASAFAAVRLDEARLQRELVMRPPVVVLNTMDWIQHAGVGSTPAVRYENGAARLHATVDQLKAHGALVLDGSALHSYPDAVRLDPPTGGKTP